MSVPTFDQFIFPLLRLLGEHPDGLRARDAHSALADALHLADDVRRAMLPAGGRPYKNRIGWAQDRLKRRGLTLSPKRGLWQITDSGREFLAHHPIGITPDEVDWIAEADRDDTEQVDPATSVAVPAASDACVPAAAQTPLDRIEVAVGELRDSVAEQILDEIGRATPEFFERLVLDLLRALGYGRDGGDLQHVGGTGDGGIDGVVSLDRLGVEKLYVQAKKYRDRSVPVEEVRAFFGAMQERRASRGVFMTTSGFSRPSKEFAANVGVALVDGRRLAQLMIEHHVGVTVDRVVEIVRVDGDYFEEE